MARIPLTKGKFAVVDDADYPWLTRWRWQFNERYAARRAGRQTVYMHREILGLRPGDGRSSDHLNGDCLDNTRANLRVVTHAENMQNRRPVPGHASRYRGVTFVKSGRRSRRWLAQVGRDAVNHNLGYYATELDAAAVAARWRHVNMPGAIEDPALLAHEVKPHPPHLATVRYREKAREVERRWQAGESLNEIADALGCTRNAVGALVARLRKEGYDLPYRRAGWVSPS